jgi:hypothetical protein
MVQQVAEMLALDSTLMCIIAYAISNNDPRDNRIICTKTSQKLKNMQNIPGGFH